MTQPELIPDHPRVLFSDVDGTLIDEEGRLPTAWPMVRRALEGTLVVLTSSRTVEELLAIQHATGIEGPFIAENGALLVLTNEWLDQGHGSVVRAGDRLLRLLPIGRPETELRTIIRGAAAASGVVIETQRSASSADLGGRSGGVAAHALARAYSVLVRIAGGAAARLHFFASLTASGLTVTHGGRWHVIQGGSSKGLAARTMLRLIQRRTGRTALAIAVGDGDNDASLLQVADVRVAMRLPDGSVHPSLDALPELVVPEAPGPEGWPEVLARLHPVLHGGMVHA